MRLSTMLIHALIDQEVAQTKEKLEDCPYKEDLNDTVCNAVAKYINVNHETRTRQDLLNAIAHLEHIAGCYRDEIADGQYQDPKPEDMEKTPVIQIVIHL